MYHLKNNCNAFPLVSCIVFGFLDLNDLDQPENLSRLDLTLRCIATL